MSREHVFLFQTWQSRMSSGMHSGGPHGSPCTTVVASAGKADWSFRTLTFIMLFIYLVTVSVCLLLYLYRPPLQGRGNERRLWIAVGWLWGSGEAGQSDAQLGCLQWGESVDRSLASVFKPQLSADRVPPVSVCCRWLVAAGLETPTPMRPSSAPWRRTGSCVSPCHFLYRMSTCWTGLCRASHPVRLGLHPACPARPQSEDNLWLWSNVSEPGHILLLRKSTI